MRVKVEQVVNSADAIGKLSRLELPIATAVKVRRLFAEMREVAESAERRRIGLASKYGTLDGDVFRFDGDAAEKFSSEYGKELQHEVEITNTVSLADIPDDASMSAADIDALWWMLGDDESPENPEERSGAEPAD